VRSSLQRPILREGTWLPIKWTHGSHLSRGPVLHLQSPTYPSTWNTEFDGFNKPWFVLRFPSNKPALYCFSFELPYYLFSRPFPGGKRKSRLTTPNLSLTPKQQNPSLPSQNNSRVFLSPVRRKRILLHLVVSGDQVPKWWYTISFANNAVFLRLLFAWYSFPLLATPHRAFPRLPRDSLFLVR